MAKLRRKSRVRWSAWLGEVSFGKSSPFLRETELTGTVAESSDSLAHKFSLHQFIQMIFRKIRQETKPLCYLLDRDVRPLLIKKLQNYSRIRLQIFSNQTLILRNQ